MSGDIGNLDLLGILRAQAWERAKGELRSILVAYIGDPGKYELMDKTLAAFVKKVEDNGLAE